MTLQSIAPLVTQSEYALEESLISQLEGMEYSRIKIDDEFGMLANLKRQLEIHNKLTLSTEEFDKVLNRLNTGDVFTRVRIPLIVTVCSKFIVTNKLLMLEG